MPTIRTNDGTTIFYKDLGAGPPILALHAWSLSSDMWEYQIPSLVEAGHRVVAPDRRGHGRSDIPGTGYDLDTLADDVAALIDALDLRDVTILAHSMGTCEAVRYLSRHGQDRVARAVLVGVMTPHLAGAVGTEFVDAVVADLHADRPAWFPTAPTATSPGHDRACRRPPQITESPRSWPRPSRSRRRACAASPRRISPTSSERSGRRRW